jgi:NAD(P)-dependent dehydrogenase (short-subunit alcohol dehydrogenase family)
MAEASTGGGVALVTGGAGGIGLGIVEALVRRGWSVLAGGIGAAEIAAFPAGERRAVRHLDVTDDASVAAAMAALPRLDLLVNAAGIIQRGGAEFAIEAFRRTLEVNLVGTMRVSLAAHGALKASGGSVINLASMLAFHGSSVVPGYSASKGGVVQLTKSLAAAWAADGVRVNAVAPGWIETPMTRPLVEDSQRSAGITGRTPMGRWGQPAEVGDVVAFLASPDARFMTGAIVPVDGGYLAV